MVSTILFILTVIKALLLAAAALMVIWLAYLSLVPGLVDGPPYVGSKDPAVRAMLSLAALRPGEKVVDLGSGDGRLLIAAAKAGCHAVGYEINPFLALWSWMRLRRLGLADRARVRCGDFWRADLRGADVVMVFGFSTIMGRLQRKFASEMKAGGRVISSRYRLPDWSPERELERVFLYVKRG